MVPRQDDAVAGGALCRALSAHAPSRARPCPSFSPRPIPGGSIRRASWQRSRLNATSLRRSEDAFVDELFSGAVALGAPLIWRRAFRAPFWMPIARPAELDASMFDGALPMPVDAPSPRVAAGLGVIPRIVRDGAEIYRGKLSPDEAETRLARSVPALSRGAVAACRGNARAIRRGGGDRLPFHAVGGGDSRHRAGRSLRHGCRAEPDAPRRNRFRANAASPCAQRALRGRLHDLSLRPAVARHSRACRSRSIARSYLDEERIVPGPRFGDVRARIAEALGELIAIDPALLCPARDMKWAAE